MPSTVNRHRRAAIALVLLAFPAARAEAQTRIEAVGTAIISHSSGGSVRITRGLTAVSARSSLELDWFMVTDSTLGMVFNEPVGARGEEDDGWYHYRVDMHMEALQPVKAFEVRVLTFNVWGEFTGTLSFTQLEDLESGQEKTFDGRWGYLPESPVRAHLRSIAYVATVMLDDGTVVRADPEPVLLIARRIQESITLQDLEPTTEPSRITVTD